MLCGTYAETIQTGWRTLIIGVSLVVFSGCAESLDGAKVKRLAPILPNNRTLSSQPAEQLPPMQLGANTEGGMIRPQGITAGAVVGGVVGGNIIRKQASSNSFRVSGGAYAF